MGRTENIKRAKRLKAAKRKREQDALIAAGMGPAAKVLQKRNADTGIETRLNKNGIKYSELLKKFVHPIVSDTDDISIIKTKYIFGAHAWNSAVLREVSEDLFQKAKNEMLRMTPEIIEVEALFDEMIKRKEEEFSEYKNIIADLEIKKISGPDYDLTVATTPLKS